MFIGQVTRKILWKGTGGCFMHRSPYKTVYASHGFCVTWTKRQGGERTNEGQWFDVSPCHRQPDQGLEPRCRRLLISAGTVFLSPEMIAGRATHCQWNRALSPVAEKYGRRWNSSNVAPSTIWQLSISQVVLTKAFTAVPFHPACFSTLRRSSSWFFPWCRHTPRPCFPYHRHSPLSS